MVPKLNKLRLYSFESGFFFWGYVARLWIGMGMCVMCDHCYTTLYITVYCDICVYLNASLRSFRYGLCFLFFFPPARLPIIFDGIFIQTWRGDAYFGSITGSCWLWECSPAQTLACTQLATCVLLIASHNAAKKNTVKLRRKTALKI